MVVVVVADSGGLVGTLAVEVLVLWGAEHGVLFGASIASGADRWGARVRAGGAVCSSTVSSGAERLLGWTSGDVGGGIHMRCDGSSDRTSGLLGALGRGVVDEGARKLAAIHVLVFSGLGGVVVGMGRHRSSRECDSICRKKS
jgi:hypothetical protein